MSTAILLAVPTLGVLPWLLVEVARRWAARTP